MQPSDRPSQRRSPGGGYGAKPPGPVKSIDFRVLSPHLKRKKFKSPLDKLLTTSLSPSEVHQHAAWNPLFNTHSTNWFTAFSI